MGKSYIVIINTCWGLNVSQNLGSLEEVKDYIITSKKKAYDDVEIFECSDYVDVYELMNKEADKDPTNV